MCLHAALSFGFCWSLKKPFVPHWRSQPPSHRLGHWSTGAISSCCAIYSRLAADRCGDGWNGSEHSCTGFVALISPTPLSPSVLAYPPYLPLSLHPCLLPFFTSSLPTPLYYPSAIPIHNTRILRSSASEGEQQYRQYKICGKRQIVEPEETAFLSICLSVWPPVAAPLVSCP